VTLHGSQERGIEVAAVRTLFSIITLGRGPALGRRRSWPIRRPRWWWRGKFRPDEVSLRPPLGPCRATR
jgi:hypothetical protein